MPDFPVSIGGLGGSGTRIVAKIAQECGIFIGSDLPVSNDTVWYAALFGRRNVLLDDQAELRPLFDLFARQMSRPSALNDAELDRLEQLLHPDRIQHDPETLRSWMDGFVQHCANAQPAQRWGWKVPYTHVLIDRLLDWSPDLRYIHTTRRGLDMAFSANKNQVEKWAPIFLNRDVEMTPHYALKYWCAVEKRVQGIKEQHPDRVYLLDFEELTLDPEKEIGRLADFMAADLPAENKNRLLELISVPSSIDRHKDEDLSVLDRIDVEFALQRVGAMKKGRNDE